MEFYDYANRPLNPNVNVVLNNTKGEELEVTDTPRNLVFGTREGGDLHAYWAIENNSMVVRGIKVSTPRKVTGAYYFSMLSLTTSDKSYTKFKYIQ